MLKQMLFFVPFAVLPCIVVPANASVAAQGLQNETGLDLDFDETDANGDGKLSTAEVTAVLVKALTRQLKDQVGDQAEVLAKQIAPEMTNKLFEQFDTNKDGFLTKDEMQPPSE